MTEHHQLNDGRVLPIITEFYLDDVIVRVLQEVEAAYEWVLTWTNGINEWIERYTLPEHAYARMAVLLRAIQLEVFVREHDELTSFILDTDDYLNRQLDG